MKDKPIVHVRKPAQRKLGRGAFILGLVWLLGAIGPTVQAALPTATESNTRQSADPLAVFGVAMFPLDETGGLEKIASPAANSTWAQGVGAKGLEVVWSNVEPNPGEYHWEVLDTVAQYLQNAFDNGLTPIVIVRGTPAWAQGEPYNTCRPMNADHFADFGDFIGQVITNTASPLSGFDIPYWEIWNEPDIDPDLVGSGNWWGGCWGDKDDSEFYGGKHYGAMLKEVTPRIQAANPNAQVLVGGLLLDCDPDNPPDDPDNPGNPKDCSSANFLRGILEGGGGSYFDGVSFHAYDYHDKGTPLGRYANPNWNSGWNTTGPVSIAKGEYLRSVLSEYGYIDKYLINTENALLLCDPVPGCEPDADSELTKAYYVAQTYAAVIAEGFVANIWYDARGWWGRGNGLLAGEYPDFIELDAYKAYRFASQELEGAFGGRRIGEYAGVTGYEIAFDDETPPPPQSPSPPWPDHVWLLWSLDGEDHPIHLPAMPQAVYDVYGNPLAASADLTITLSPVYVELPAVLPRIRLPIIAHDCCYYFGGFWEEEDNDSYLEANGPLRSGRDYYGYPDDAKDWFSLEIKQVGHITITLTPPSGWDGQLQLFWQDTNHRVAYVTNPPYVIDYQPAQPGWYYIYVYTIEPYSATESYTLKVTYP